VVSGSVLDSVFVRRLQDGDADGSLRRAMLRFPIAGVANRVLREYFRPNGRRPGEAYRLLPMYQQSASRVREQLTMLASFVEVTLAKEGHSGRVGVNLLTKVQLPTLATLFGAMLADVDCVLMGAGIPREIPGALDALAGGREARLRLEVAGEVGDRTEWLRFDPLDHFPDGPPGVRRPHFFAIVSSHALATVLSRKASGRVDGFVIESHRAGGHNAPPRAAAAPNARGEPIYGERDVVDLARLRELGLPFWIAGGVGRPERLHEALAAGAAGVQVGSLFACCDESGMAEPLKRALVAAAGRGELDVFTDPLASPTGYPFKLARWPGSGVGPERERTCDIGALRMAYRTATGGLGYRCASEPEHQYIAKGGDPAEARGRRCLCNGLMATIGHGQLRADGSLEPELVTIGDDFMSCSEFLSGRTHYSASDVLEYVLGAGAPA